jgi:hypothetical protein
MLISPNARRSLGIHRSVNRPWSDRSVPINALVAVSSAASERVVGDFVDRHKRRLGNDAQYRSAGDLNAVGHIRFSAISLRMA